MVPDGAAWSRRLVARLTGPRGVADWSPVFARPKTHAAQNPDEKEMWPMIFEKVRKGPPCPPPRAKCRRHLPPTTPAAVSQQL
jgi:hypothetical protein